MHCDCDEQFWHPIKLHGKHEPEEEKYPVGQTVQLFWNKERLFKHS